MPVDVESLLQTVLTSAKKLPGQIVGGPVDITNILMGAVVGKKLDGLVKEPVGGSAQINKAFGLSPESSGTGEDLVSLLMNLATPSGAAKGAIVVPALLTKTFKEIKEADKLLQSGKSAEEVYKATGIYRTSLDDIPRTVISDAGAKLNPALIKREAGSFTDAKGPTQTIRVGAKDSSFSDTYRLGDVLDHPELFKAMPDLKDVKVGREFGGYKSAYFSSDVNKIGMGVQTTEKEFMTTLLHEIQHAVQSKGGMVSGGNPGMFLADKKNVETATTEIRRMKDEAFARLKKKAEKEGENIYRPSKKFEDSLEWRQLDFLETQLNRFHELSDQSYKGYKRIGGEAEARATQRMYENQDYTAFPLGQYDVPLKSLIRPDQIRPLDQDPVIRGIIEHLVKTIPAGK